MPLGGEPLGDRNKSYDSVRHHFCYQTLIYAEFCRLDVDSILVCYISLGTINFGARCDQSRSLWAVLSDFTG